MVEQFCKSELRSNIFGHCASTMTALQQSPQNSDESSSHGPFSSRTSTTMKCLVAGVLLISAFVAYTDHRGSPTASVASASTTMSASSFLFEDDLHQRGRRRLSMIIGDTIPKYMENLTKELRERKKLFDETPPEEVKYWFEYTGPLQVSLE